MTKKSKPDIYTRKTIFDDLNKYCIFAKDNEFIEITYWRNGEGFDVTISTHEDNIYSFTWGEFEAIKKLIKILDKTENV